MYFLNELKTSCPDGTFTTATQSFSERDNQTNKIKTNNYPLSYNLRWLFIDIVYSMLVSSIVIVIFYSC